jgi:hypothetical protein
MRVLTVHPAIEAAMIDATTIAEQQRTMIQHAWFHARVSRHRTSAWIMRWGCMALTFAIAALSSCMATAAEGDAGAAAPSAADAAVSSVEWPLVSGYQQGELRLYHPHVESLKGDLLTARAAFSMTTGPDAAPTFGVVWLSARATIDREERTITLSNQVATKVHLPASSATDETALTAAVTTLVAGRTPVLRLDRILTTLSDAERDHQAENRLDATPPTIIVVERRAMLLYLDGEPRFAAISGSRLERIVNTPYPLVRDPATGSYSLLYNGRWYAAPTITGPWAPLDHVGSEYSSLTTRLQGGGASGSVVPSGAAVDIVVSQKPAELISIDGAPAYEPIPGTTLLAVTNTESDLFESTATQQHYALLNGRWYHTGDLAHGMWDHVANGGLPADFAHIPPGSPYADLLAHVPGTPEAADAVLDAQVPQTAAVKRDATIQVPYDGEPQWQPIASTPMSYAVNSPMDVIKVSDGDYYCCYQGVWYRASSPSGPWAVSTSRPADINAIPPDNPLYNDTYVAVYDSTPDYVDVGYTPGYLGSYIDDGLVVWGTGFYYNGWWGHGYRPRQSTWGFGMAYNPWTGHWGVGRHGLGVNYGGFGPERYPSGWWGPAGYRPFISLRQTTDSHGNRPVSEGRPEGHERVFEQNADNLYRNSENRDRVLSDTISHAPIHAPTAARPNPSAPAREPERYMTTHEGEVYRAQGTGWQQWQRNGWTNLPQEERHEQPLAPERRAPAPIREEPAQHVQEPAQHVQEPAPHAQELPREQPQTRYEQLNSQRQFEDRGIQRSQQFQQYRSSPPSSSRSYGGGASGARH